MENALKLNGSTLIVWEHFYFLVFSMVQSDMKRPLGSVKDKRLRQAAQNTYMAIPRNPFNGATPHITPRITAIICRIQ